MSDSNSVDREGQWPHLVKDCDDHEDEAVSQLKYPSRMPGSVTYTTRRMARASATDAERDAEEQIQLSEALGVALNEVRKARDVSVREPAPSHGDQSAIVQGDNSPMSNMVPIVEVPPAGSETLEEDLPDSPAPVAAFAPANDFSVDENAAYLANSNEDDAYRGEMYFEEAEAVNAEPHRQSEIPQSIQDQTIQAHYTHGAYDPQVTARKFRGASYAAGFSAVVVAGFLGLYFYNSPSATIANLDFPNFLETALSPGSDSPALSESSPQPQNAGSGSVQSLLAPVPVTSVAVRANPHLTVGPVQGEAGRDIPLTIGVSPVPGENTSVIINGLPEGASLNAGIESTKGVWIVKPVDLAALVLQTPLGISGRYDVDIELMSANGNTIDRKVFSVILSAELFSTQPVITTSAPELEASLPVQNETSAASAVVPVATTPASPAANAYAASAYENAAFVASGLSLFDFQERAKANGLMIARGDNFMANGDISSARLLFERAGKDSSAVGATLAAMTYDPIILKGHGNHSIRSDAGAAQIWYAKAIALGSDEAKVRRAALDEYLAAN